MKIYFGMSPKSPRFGEKSLLYDGLVSILIKRGCVPRMGENLKTVKGTNYQMSIWA